MKQPSSRSGYIAITSALIIAALVTVMAVSLGLSSYLAQTSLSRAYYKEASQALAEGCFEEALLKFAQDPAYTGNETIAIASATCAIVSVEDVGVNWEFQTNAIFLSAASNVQATIAEDLTIVGWEELVEL